MVKFWIYSSASLLACAALLWYTYATRQQFYPAVIYLVTSKISVLVLGNTGLVLSMLLGRLVKSLFLGSLRDAEVEILHENVRYAVTETCLALTIFREEINAHVMALFTVLVFLKVFHWLAQARIEFMEQTDAASRLTHVRLVALMALLAAVDAGLVWFCSAKVLALGPSVYILFGFEFLILLVTLASTLLRYALYVVDSRMDGAWTNKFTYLFYLELVSEVVKLVVYLVFFMLIFTYYGMPLHIVRDLWVSIKNLQRRVASYFRYRKITANLNEHFPSPTEDELRATDRTCIICREEMTPAACKKLPCSHIFHVDCLKMWVQRQQTCPTCRSTIPTGPRAPPPPPADVQAAPVHDQPPVPVPVAAAAPAPAPPVNGPPVNVPAAHAPAAVARAQAPPPGAAAVPGLAPAGYNPFMQPMLFAPPFGFGGFGMMPPPANMDPQAIQQQLDLLQAQLAVLQAATGQVPPGAPAPVPQVVVAEPAAAPAAAATVAANATADAATADAATAAASSSAATTARPSQSKAESADDLEEKAPAPTEPQERAIPPAPMTEAERRREELRRRYARIYGSSAGEAASGDTDEGKEG